ncbi:MAG: hypothetical protein ACXVBG_22025, partial [Isosphaeraceae bacterium]
MPDIVAECFRTQRPLAGGDPILEEIQGLLAVLGVFGEQDVGVGTVGAEFEGLLGELDPLHGVVRLERLVHQVL